MADIISILLKARIDDGSIGQIQDQINNIQNKAKPVEIKVDTTKSTQNVKNITSSFEKLEEVTKKNLSLDLDRLSNRYKNLVKPTDIAQVRAMIDALKYDDPKLGHNIDLIKVKMKEMSVGAEQSRKSLDLANKSAMSFGESIKTAASKFLIWSGEHYTPLVLVTIH